MKLKAKVAVITGGGRGLGRAIASEMAKEGARVALMSRSEAEINQVLKTIEHSGGEGLAFPGDISQEGDVSRLIEETLRRFSTVHILVNNAAITGPARFLKDTDFEAWQKTIDVNLNGVFLCSRVVVPVMAKQGQGKIINISSGLGQMPFPRFSAYAVAKAGVMQLTRSLAEELKELNIQVNAIDPGVMDTDMQRQLRALGSPILGERIHRQFLEFKERGLLKHPARIAPLAVFLASEEADHISGHNGTLDYYMKLGWQP